MERWAGSALAHDCTFLCVCVDQRAEATAREFNRLYLTGGKCLNAFIDNPHDMPRFPASLGCQGLVILDREHRFVTTRSSPAFLDQGPDALDVVERVLSRLLGEPVVLEGLKADHLNGLRGVIAAGEPVDEGRVAVRLEDGRVLAVRRENAVKAASGVKADLPTAMPAGGCCGDPGRCESKSCDKPEACATKPVTLHGLSKTPELNGCRGELLPDSLPEGRVAVRLSDGRVLAVQPQNVKLESAPSDEGETAVFPENACEANKASKVAPLPSVGHKQMDAEHAELTACMRDFVESRNARELEALRDLFAEHAEHEERLMKRVGFGGSVDDAFSAAASHAKDHARIVRLADDALEAGGSIIPVAAVDAITRAIQLHAERYDVLYADAVSTSA